MSQDSQRVRYIGSPYGMGVRGYMSGSGPLGVLENAQFLNGAENLLGSAPQIEWVDADEPHGLSYSLPRGDQIARMMQQNYDVQEIVASTIGNQEFPILLSGTCSTGVGVIGGLNDPSIGVVWLDAHADMSTPETSTSGFFGGMPLAIINGKCFAPLRASVPGFHVVPEERIVSVGMHDLLEGRPGPAGQVVDRSAIDQSGGMRNAIGSALDKIGEHCDSVYLHVDTDVLSKSVTAVHHFADHVNGGLTLEEIKESIDLVFEKSRVLAVNFTNFDSTHDRRTVPVMIALVLHTTHRVLESIEHLSS